MTDHPGFPAEPRVKHLVSMLEPVTRRSTSNGERADAGVADALTQVRQLST